MKRCHCLAAWVGAAAFAAAGLGCSVAADSATARANVGQAAPAPVAPVQTAPASSNRAPEFDRPGFIAFRDRSGRVWIHPEGSAELAGFLKDGPPANHVIRPSAGPGGVTLRAVEGRTLDEYLTWKPGFFTQADKDGRIWVFRENSPELGKFLRDGPPPQQVLRPGAGPLGLTLKALDAKILNEYAAAKPGFFVQADQRDGRIWVFRENSPELEMFLRDGPPPQQVLRPGAGPRGLTLKALDAKILDEYATAKPGFFVRADKDGRIWVFRENTPELEKFLRDGPPPQQVLRPGAGPRGLTLKALDASILDAYMSANGG